MIPKAGDIIAVESQQLYGKLIKRVQKRIGYTSAQASVTHIAVCVSNKCQLYEMSTHGLIVSNLNDYNGTRYHILRHNKAKGKEIAEKAKEISKNKKFNTESYDFLLITGLWLFSLGFSKKILKLFNIKQSFICSEFALEIFKELKIIKPKENKLYFPAEWIKWRDEGFFTEL